jgi:hypothetical protein
MSCSDVRQLFWGNIRYGRSQEPIVRLGLDGTAARVRLDR